jgi:hypothetical protein
MLGAMKWIFSQFLSATVVSDVERVSAPSTTPSCPACCGGQVCRRLKQRGRRNHTSLHLEDEPDDGSAGLCEARGLDALGLKKRVPRAQVEVKRPGDDHGVALYQSGRVLRNAMRRSITVFTSVQQTREDLKGRELVDCQKELETVEDTTVIRTPCKVFASPSWEDPVRPCQAAQLGGDLQVSSELVEDIREYRGLCVKRSLRIQQRSEDCSSARLLLKFAVRQSA